MLELYRRHTKNCPDRGEGQNYTRCNCPIWAYGCLDGQVKPIRKTLGTRDWRRAVRKLDNWEENPEKAMRQAPGTEPAVERYLENCRNRKLASATVKSYTIILQSMAAFMKSRAYRVDQIEPTDLEAFQNSRQVEATTQRKDIANLRAFFWFAVRMKWRGDNPAKALKLPREETMPTMPFENGELKALLGACERMSNPNRRGIPRAILRARALILTLAYSGFRISDVAKLKRDQLNPTTGDLVVRIMKSRRDLYIILPPECVMALLALPRESDYFFWNGTGALATCVGSMRRTLSCLGKLAGVSNVHPHRFRDTFAVELLSNGEDIRTVQQILGHRSVKITEKHYAPFVKSFQDTISKATKKLAYNL